MKSITKSIDDEHPVDMAVQWSWFLAIVAFFLSWSRPCTDNNSATFCSVLEVDELSDISLSDGINEMNFRNRNFFCVFGSVDMWWIEIPKGTYLFGAYAFHRYYWFAVTLSCRSCRWYGKNCRFGSGSAHVRNCRVRYWDINGFAIDGAEFRCI